MQSNKLVLINYVDTLDLFYSYLNMGKLEQDKGISDILFILVTSYLCDNTAREEDGLPSMLDYYGLYNFEISEIGFQVSNSIINTTMNYMPGFKSYDNNHYLDKSNIKHLHGSSILINLTNDQFSLFVNKPKEFLNARISNI